MGRDGVSDNRIKTKVSAKAKPRLKPAVQPNARTNLLTAKAKLKDPTSKIHEIR